MSFNTNNSEICIRYVTFLVDDGAIHGSKNQIRQMQKKIEQIKNPEKATSKQQIGPRQPQYIKKDNNENELKKGSFCCQ